MFGTTNKRKLSLTVLLGGIQLVILLAASSAAGQFQPAFGNHSHPVGGLDAELTGTASGVVVSTPAGQWRINPAASRVKLSSTHFWNSEGTLPIGDRDLPGLQNGGEQYIPRSRGVEKRSASGSKILSLDGYRPNDLVEYNGRVWAGTLGGIFVERNGRFQHRGDFPERIVALESWRHMLVFLTPETVGVYDGNVIETTRLPGPTDNHISALLRTPNRLVVGTFNDGISVLEKDGWRHYEDQLPSPKVNALARFRGEVWIGTSAGPAVLSGGEISKVEVENWHSAVSDFATTDKRLFMTGGDQMAKYDGSTWSVTRHKRRPFWQSATIYRGSMAVGGMEGLQHFGNVDLPAKPELADPWVTAVLGTPKGLYFGTYDAGLYRYDGGKIEAVNTTAWVTPRSVASLDGKILVGTRGNGLEIVNRDGQIRLIGKNEGLAGGEVTAIAVDKRGVWVGTRNGLSYLPASAVSGTKQTEPAYPKGASCSTGSQMMVALE
jgi:ligand-binding sensor domain-containing protein